MNPAAPVTRRRIGRILWTLRVAVAKLLCRVDLAAVALDLLGRPERIVRALAVAEIRKRGPEVVQRVGLVELPGAAKAGQRRLGLGRRLLIPAGVQVGGGLVDECRGALASG